jgi:hypothetical protein
LASVFADDCPPLLNDLPEKKVNQKDSLSINLLDTLWSQYLLIIATALTE